MDDSPICIYYPPVHLLDPQELPATEAADQFVVLGFIEVGGRGQSAEAVRSRTLDWFEKRFGTALPDATRNSEESRAINGKRTIISASELEGEDLIWAWWLDVPLDQVPNSCLTTEAVIRSRDGKVDRMGFRLLAQVPSNRIPVTGRNEGLPAAIEAFCDLYSTATGTSSQCSFVISNDQARQLAAGVLDSERTLPVIVVSTKRNAQRVSATRLDASALAKATNGLARVYVLHNSQSRTVTRELGRKLSVFNGSVRIYMPGVEEGANTGRDQLHLTGEAPSADEVDRTWVSFQRLAARESGDQFRTNAGRLPYESLERKAASLHRGPKADENDPPPQAKDPARADRHGQSTSRSWRRSRDLLERIRTGLPLLIRRVFRLPKGAPGNTRAGTAAAQEIGRLKRGLKDARAERDRLARKLAAARSKNEGLAAEIRQFADTLKERDLRIAELEGSLAETRPLPGSWERVISWSDNELSNRVMLTGAVRKDLPHAQYKDVEMAARGLKWLATEYRDARMRGQSGDIRGPIAGIEGLCNERCGSHSFAINWQGESQRVEWHLTRGNSYDPRRCLRIYYFWDSQLEQVVVASMPAHRP